MATTLTSGVIDVAQPYASDLPKELNEKPADLLKHRHVNIPGAVDPATIGRLLQEVENIDVGRWRGIFNRERPTENRECTPPFLSWTTQFGPTCGVVVPPPCPCAFPHTTETTMAHALKSVLDRRFGQRGCNLWGHA